MICSGVQVILYQPVPYPRCSNTSLEPNLDRIRLLNLPTYRWPTCHRGDQRQRRRLPSTLFDPPSTFRRPIQQSTPLIHCNQRASLSPPTCTIKFQIRGEVERLNRELGAQVSKLEVLTSIPMSIFRRPKMEVGTGGRLDVTNAILDEAVVVPAVTSTDLDHRRFLGDTVAEVARRGPRRLLGTPYWGMISKVIFSELCC